jgi:hypothetical protein
MSYPRDSEKEGFCLATVKKVRIGLGLMVAYECHRHNHGQLDGKASGTLTLSQALGFRNAFVSKTFIPHPHPLSFNAVYVTHATANTETMVGKYVLTPLVVNARPVFRKEYASQGPVTYLWRTRDEKWIFGTLAQMNNTPSQGFAVAAESTLWAHYTHDYYMQNIKCKIFSYAIKGDYPAREQPLQVDLANSTGSDSDESAEDDEGGAADVGAGKRKNTEQDRTAQSKKNKGGVPVR